MTVTITQVRNAGDGAHGPPVCIIVTCAARPPGLSRTEVLARSRSKWPTGGHHFTFLPTPTTNTGRSCTKVSSIDPKRCALSPTRATLLFSLRASQTFQPNTRAHPTSRRPACWCRRHSNARFGERLARVCAVERRVRASDLPTSRGASGRRTGGRASVRRGTSILGWEPWRAEKHAHRAKKHVDTIDDDHAYPMLRRCIFALSRVTRADIIRTLVCIGGEILLSVMGS